MTTRDGGCLCGSIRYRLNGEPASEGAGYCHCRNCQRSAGSPVLAWVTFPREQISILQGEPRRYHSSPKAVREFCSDCGTQLFFAYTEGPNDVDVTIASLDDPGTLPPAYHIWTSSQQPWLVIDDKLPRFEDDGEDFSPYHSPSL